MEKKSILVHLWIIVRNFYKNSKLPLADLINKIHAKGQIISFVPANPK